MKIVYSAAIGHKLKNNEDLAVQLVPHYLRSSGHEVATFLYDPGQSDENGSFDKIVKEILDADVFISEMSRASQTLGFQLSFALANTKPSLYLYQTGTSSKPGSIVRNNPSRLLKINDYDKFTYEKTLSSFLKFASQQQQSTRTSFMSTQKIDESISELSKKQSVSKGEVIRQLLTDSINRINKS